MDHGSPFVEGSGALLLEHGEGTAASAAVLAEGRVHVSRLDYVDRGGNDGGAETCPKGRSEVARKVICRGGGTGKGVRTPHPIIPEGERFLRSWGLVILERLQLGPLLRI